MSTNVLLDTNIVSLLLGKTKGWVEPIEKELSAHNQVNLFVSAVTLQELMVWAHREKKGEELLSHLRNANVEILSFDEDCALLGGKIASLLWKKPSGSKSEKQDMKDRWHRDASIAATAVRRGMHSLLTANGKDFRLLEASLTPVKLAVVSKIEGA